MIKIEKINISLLKEWDKNQREISDEKFETIKESIKRNPDFLNKRPLLVNKINNKFIVYAGNQRLKAVIALGWEEVPCIVSENLDEDKMKEEALIDNVQWGEFILKKIRLLNLDTEFLNLVDIHIENLNIVEDIKNEYDSFPDYTMENKDAVKKLVVNFLTLDDVEKFSKVIGQKITENTRYIWFPFREKNVLKDKYYE